MSYTGMFMPATGITNQSPAAPADNGAQADQDDDQQSTATDRAKYVAPEDGQPTICQNCSHFDGQGACDHPEVIADPEVSGKVEANGHCMYFKAGSGEQSVSNILPMKKPAISKGADAIGAGAKFPKVSNTPNYQG